MTTAGAPTYRLRDLESMLGLSRSVITGLVDAGFVRPARGARREYLFTFRDVVLLRTASRLQAARIAPRKIVSSLRRLRATLPAELPISGLRIAAVGSEVAVCEGDTQWQADSGQLLFDFDVQPARGSVRFLDRPAQAEKTDWFARGVELEASDPPQAEAAYRRAIGESPPHVDAVLNLGVMLCDSGRCAEAVTLYRGALASRPREALLHFNLAVALEDLPHTADALESYEQCLRLQPDFADAHFNLARLHEALGQPRKAIRHYSEYRRLVR